MEFLEEDIWDSTFRLFDWLGSINDSMCTKQCLFETILGLLNLCLDLLWKELYTVYKKSYVLVITWPQVLYAKYWQSGTVVM